MTGDQQGDHLLAYLLIGQRHAAGFVLRCQQHTEQIILWLAAAPRSNNIQYSLIQLAQCALKGKVLGGWKPIGQGEWVLRPVNDVIQRRQHCTGQARRIGA